MMIIHLLQDYRINGSGSGVITHQHIAVATGLFNFYNETTSTEDVLFNTWRLGIMATLKVNTLTGTSTAGSIAVTGEGNSTTTNFTAGVKQSMVKYISRWNYFKR